MFYDGGYSMGGIQYEQRKALLDRDAALEPD